MVRSVLLFVSLVGLCACPSKSSPTVDAGPARAVAKPLEPLERAVADVDVDAGAADDEDPLYRVVPVPPVGPKLPEGATLVRFADDKPMVNGAPLDLGKVQGPLVIDPGETYFAQVFDFFAKADDQKLEVWLKHPDAPVAIRLTLRDEVQFQRWLDEPVPGKLRVIHRQDGFELQTNMGKLPGGDPKGPTVPVRGGHLDLKTFQKGLGRIKARFDDAPDYCVMPSFGMDLSQVARAMAANYQSEDKAWFAETCIVFHRAGQDGGR
jgi:hypothetical protein